MCTWQQSIKNRERERERERQCVIKIFIIIPPAKKLKYDSEIMKSYICIIYIFNIVVSLYDISYDHISLFILFNNSCFRFLRCFWKSYTVILLKCEAASKPLCIYTRMSAATKSFKS